MSTTERPDSTPGARWSRLSTLLADLERAFETNCRLDALDAEARAAKRTYHYVDEPGRVAEQLAERFERRLAWIENAMDREIDRLTVERIKGDLERRKRR